MTNALKKRGTPKIPLIDLNAQYRSIQPEIDEAIQRVIKSSAFILGQEVEAFEHEFAAFVGSKHGTGVSSGTAALHLTLLACGVRPGDEVITTPLTFIATAEAVRHAGALPVFVDVEQESLCLDPRLIASAVTPRTKAVLVVHLHGNPAPMEAILEAGVRYGLTVLEDAAQAHGAEYRGRRAGSARPAWPRRPTRGSAGSIRAATAGHRCRAAARSRPLPSTRSRARPPRSSRGDQPALRRRAPPRSCRQES